MFRLKMAFELICVFFLASVVDSMSVHQNCQSDTDCTQFNTYCYQSRKCVDCTDCSVYHRLNGTGCAKNKNHCGDCISGMAVVPNIDGTFSCSPSSETSEASRTSSTTVPPEPNSNFYIEITGVSTIVIILAICGIAWFICKGENSCVIILRNNLRICSRLMSPPDGPCPYEFKRHPSAPPCEEAPRAPDHPITQIIHRVVENDPNQTANAFINPHYVRGGSLETNPPVDEDNDSAENEALINSNTNASLMSLPDDEETQPSTWTPTPGSETASTGPTSFTNALGLQTLSISQPAITTQQIIPTVRSSNNNSQDQNTSESTPHLNAQQINLVAHIGPVNINFVSK